ncbi:MAG: amidohydrolase family protein [Parvibaculaceae bacterium]
MKLGPIILKNGLTDLGSGDLRRTDLLINDGKVQDISAGIEVPDVEKIDCTSFLIVPGMINSHYHSNGNFDRGLWDNLPLEPYGVFAFPRLMTPKLSSRELYIRTLIGGLEQVRSGVTCTIDFLFDPELFSPDSLGPVVKAYRDLGLRVVVVLGMNDRPYHETVLLDVNRVDRDLLELMNREKPPSWSRWEAAARGAIKMFHRPDEGVSIGLAPGAPERCTDELLSGCARLSEELNVIVQTHALETRMQSVIARERFGKTLPEHLRDLNFLSPRLSLQHGIWLTEADCELIAQSGAVVVHNPISNMKLGSGICPVPLMQRHGVDLALGTDAMSCNDNCNMQESLKIAALLHKLWDLDFEQWSGAREAWRMATRGGARSAGDPERLGRIGPGSWADLLLLDLRSHGFSPLNESIDQFVLGAPYGCIDSVMVQGQWIVRNRIVQRVDEEPILEEAREIGRDLQGRRKAAWAVADRLVQAVSEGWREARRRYSGPARLMELH